MDEKVVEQSAETPDAKTAEKAEKLREQTWEGQTHHSSESAAFRDASTNIHIHHAQIGGGFINNQQAGIGNTPHEQMTLASDMVSEIEANLVWYVYKPPANYQQAYTQLSQERVVILRGDNRVGKRTTAIKLALVHVGANS